MKIEQRDGRHGDVETNFETRSSGFQWFFSFFAAFSEYQESGDAIIVPSMNRERACTATPSTTSCATS